MDRHTEVGHAEFWARILFWAEGRAKYQEVGTNLECLRDGRRTKVALMKCIEERGEDRRLVTGRPSVHRAILERSMALF